MERIILKRIPLPVILLAFIFLFIKSACPQKLHLNDQEYFETSGVNVFVFSNQYSGMFFDEKTAGIELIHHGVRTATGGSVRLQNTPEQWDLIPTVVNRKVDKQNNCIDVTMRYKEYDFNSRVNVTPKGNGVVISVYLDKPVPDKLEGHAGFNLEFLPSSYFGKTYIVDGKAGVFPWYPSSNTTIEPISNKIMQFGGFSTFDDRGKGEFIVPKPLASGKTIILSPENPECFVKIQSTDEDIMLLDGRNLAQNGWYIVRSLLPAKKTGKVLEWYLEPNAIPKWKRNPVIEFSQVGYSPNQDKVAVIELDKTDTPLKTASIFQVTPEGKTIEKLSANLQQWGKMYRYNYLKFDFTSIKEPGIYLIKYGDQKTNIFTISNQVYSDVWHPTLDVWFPVQMDHMFVNEAYRVWHGAPFLDDALQAPVNEQHFDGYSMGSTTDSKYKPLERIPGLAVGGWFDAGDFDIRTPSLCNTVSSFVAAWEQFGLNRDETYIDQVTRYVDIHRPDGKPDILQQIEQGTLNLVAQIKSIGYPISGIIVPKLDQYHHLGDAVTQTDNLPYNPNLKPYESDGKSSGTMDDRWAFTGRTARLDYTAIATLAAASRALQSLNKPHADECILLAKKLWDEESNLPKNVTTPGRASQFNNSLVMTAAFQLFISTKDEQYANKFKELIWTELDRSLSQNISIALQAYPYMNGDYKVKLKDYVIKYKSYVDGLNKENPYGVPIGTRGWAGNAGIINWAIANYYAYKIFPDIFGREYTLKGLNYIFGCHPYSNLSFVTTVGTSPKKVAYGNNRADFSTIAGGVVPGILVLKPDFPENKDDWPFLWGENECVVDICAAYIFLSNAANELVNK